MSTKNKKSAPTHRVYAVTKSADAKFWQPVGALWAHTDGQGFNLRLESLPLNDADLVIRIAKTDRVAAKGGAQ